MSSQAAPTPLSLGGFLPAWDVERRQAPAHAVDAVAAWTLGQLQREHRVDDLATLHQHMNGPTALAAARRLTEASAAPELRRPLHRMLRSLLAELPFDRVWLQTYAHFRILVPGDTVSAVLPHVDHGFGHHLAERNVWIALTDASGPGALHITALRPSLQWLARRGDSAGLLHDAPALAPLSVARGDVLLFTPLHLHRAHPPVDATRVSIDLRLIPRDAAPDDLTFSPPLDDEEDDDAPELPR